MTAAVRPRVAFELLLRDGDDARVWVDADGRLPRFPFPGGKDWNEAVVDACRHAFGFAPASFAFVALVDGGNRSVVDDPWIGARFAVAVPPGAALPAPWRRSAEALTAEDSSETGGGAVKGDGER